MATDYGVKYTKLPAGFDVRITFFSTTNQDMRFIIFK